MKKGLFLLPLLAGFVLAGCEFTVFGKTFKFGDSSQKQTSNTTNNTTNNNTTNNTNNNTNNNGSSTKVDGTLLGTVTMSKNADLKESNDDEATFENGDCKVVVSKGQNTSNTVSAAVNGTGNYEFRVYAKFDVTFSASQAISKLLIKYSSYVNGSSTYYFDYDLSGKGATNDFDNSKYEALVTLDEASESFTVNCWHQTRIASVAFYA